MKHRWASSGEWPARLAWIAGYCIAPLALIAIALLTSGCGSPLKSRKPQLEVWDDMRRQEKFKPQQESTLFSDHRANRHPVEGAVARGHLRDDDVMHTGLASPDLYAGRNPLEINAELLQLGAARFNVYCTPCHDRAATGKGAVALKAPAWQPSNLHDSRVKKMADGEIFYIVTNGKRSMPAYRFQIQSERDRWAVVAYVRALQRMSSGSVDDVPAEMRSSLGESKSPSLLPPPPPPPPAAQQPGTSQAGASEAGGAGK